MRLGSLFLLITLLSLSDYSLGQTQSARKGAYSPEEQLKRFKLAEGFVIELVASEKDGIINPIDISFDDAGRLWTQTAEMYPLDPVQGINFGKAMKMMQDEKLIAKDPRFSKIKKLYTLETRGTDKIQIIENLDQPGKATVKTWAEGLAIPQSVMPYKDGCYVAHGSELFLMRDTDGDGKQDAVEPVLSGFGFFDTHTMSHSIVRAPGGWFNFSHGAINSGNVNIVKTGEKVNVIYCKNLRFSTDHENLEILNCLRDNVWGYQVRRNGQWYATSANDNGYSVLPMEDQTSISGIGNQKVRPYQPFFPPANKFRVGGTGISGLAFSEDGSRGFPKEWDNVAILANPITGKLNGVRIDRKENGSLESELVEDLLVCEDDWFRPVNIEFGPDGFLYIADWYNKIVSHNEVSTDHPDRDRSHGRIWRVRHQSQKVAPIPNLVAMANQDLIKYLSAEILWEKRAAWHQIVDRQAKELAPQLVSLIRSSKDDPETLIHALWSLEGLKVVDKELLQELLKSTDSNIRREAVRSLVSFGVSPTELVSLVKPLLDDKNCMVRSQVIRTIEELGSADNSSIDLLVTACKPDSSGAQLGGSYERKFERFLARKALEKYLPEFRSYLKSNAAAAQDPSHMLWALQALPGEETSSAFLSLWERVKGDGIDDNTFVSITKMLAVPEVNAALAPTFKNDSDAMLKQALKLEERINGPAVAVFYRSQIEQQLASKDQTEVNKALDTIVRLRSSAHTKTLVGLLDKSSEKAEIQSVLEALGNDPKLPISIYKKLFNRPQVDFSIRLDAVAAIAVKSVPEATKMVTPWIQKQSEPNIRAVVSRLSYTRNGSVILMNLFNKKIVGINSWDHYAALRAKKFLRRDKTLPKILKATAAKHEKDRLGRVAKIESYIKVSEKLEGNPASGQALFGMCLACHKVGDQGQQFAPALDGSSTRDLAHLITAIVNPNAAVEGAYGLHSVVRRDGSVVEGYMISSDDQGVLIGYPGGAKKFVAKPLILSQGQQDGRSFMPEIYNQFPDQVMIDLVTYIKTLK